MKTRSVIFLLLTGLGFIACQHKQPPTPPLPPPEPTPDYDTCNTGLIGMQEPTVSMMLVKFTDDKYREYILAEHISGPDVQMRGSYPPVVEELIMGKIPYTVKLPNGYWLIDWRWGITFIYRPSNVLLPYKWETLTHWNQKWEMPTNPLSFHEYIESVGYVKRRTLDTYLGINMDSSRYECRLYLQPYVYSAGYVSEKDILTEERDWYFSTIHFEDSIQAIYTQRLIDVIDSGNFDKVYNIPDDK